MLRYPLELVGQDAAGRPIRIPMIVQPPLPKDLGMDVTSPTPER